MDKALIEIFNEIQEVGDKDYIPTNLLPLGLEVTDANAALFDVNNQFKGSISGINEVLARQGLLKGNRGLLEKEKLSPGQLEEIDRVYTSYPDLNDNEFVKGNFKKRFTK